jgi:hypothetical protein
MDSLEADMLIYVNALEIENASGGSNSIPILSSCYEKHGKDLCVEWLENHFGHSMEWAKEGGLE